MVLSLGAPFQRLHQNSHPLSGVLTAHLPLPGLAEEAGGYPWGQAPHCGPRQLLLPRVAEAVVRAGQATGTAVAALAMERWGLLVAWGRSLLGFWSSAGGSACLVKIQLDFLRPRALGRDGGLLPHFTERKLVWTLIASSSLLLGDMGLESPGCRWMPLS